MVPNTKETGCSIKHVAKESSGMLMETFSRANGMTTRQMGMVSTSIRTELDMRVSGKMISNTDTVRKYGPITHNMRAFTTRVKSMDVDFTSGRMAQDTTENGSRIELRAMENISGKTVELTLDNGKIIICTVKVPIPGLTEGDTKASTKWIRNMDTVFTTGLMAVYIKAIGLMESNMARASTFSRQAKSKSVSGLTAKEPSGYTRKRELVESLEARTLTISCD